MDLEQSPDTIDVEKGAKCFVEWIKSDKLEIRAYPDHNIHAKLLSGSFPISTAL